MAVNGVTNSGADIIYNAQSAGNLGKNEFLKILVTQLQNQDPLNPVDDKEFIAQMAQFSTLEQMYALNEGVMLSRAYSLIGKTIVSEVISQDGYSTETVIGKVDSVMTSNGEIFLGIGEKYIKYGNNIGVLDSKLGAIWNDFILQGASIIGKNVKANITDENGETATITGTVEKVTLEDGTVMLTVNGVKIGVTDVIEINL